MLHFSFETMAFTDPDEARARNVNAIEGRELAVWLAARLREDGFDCSETWPEDHGWDFSLAHVEGRYLCACSLARDDGGTGEAHIVLHKARSMKDKLLGRNKFVTQDAVAAAIRAALRANPDIARITEDAADR